MFLREYIYIDVDKVSGLASQLYDGVPERATSVAAHQKNIHADIRIAGGGFGSSSEDSVERSLNDSLFKDLESDLESLGLLHDVSQKLSDSSSWSHIGDIAHPGEILRISAPGTLFHARQLSDALLGIATAAHGMADLLSDEGSKADTRSNPSRKKTDAQRRPERAAKQPLTEPRFPEDFLPVGNQIPIMDIPRRQLAGMIKLVRGVFGEGVHLNLRPAGAEGPTITVRLESGRRFLDSSPDVLMSRYGLYEQEWTVTGIVGQLGRQAPSSEVFDITNEDQSLNRAKLVDLVGNFMSQTAGLVDIPQDMGFSVVPLALYRTIGAAPIDG